MVVKAPKVKESPEAVSARKRAEEEAEKNLVGETRRGVSAETAAILRRFGIKAAMSGSPGAAASVSDGGIGTYNPGTSSGFAGGIKGFSKFSTGDDLGAA